MTLYYVDEVGFSLALPITYTWSRPGRAHTLAFPTRWSSSGRLNLIGALRLKGQQRTLYYELLEESVKSRHVIAFLERLATSCSPNHLSVVVLDNATFHRAKGVRERRTAWEEKGLYVRFLPTYSPHLNLIETLWKRLKAFLLPRRCYASLTDLRTALKAALDLLGAAAL